VRYEIIRPNGTRVMNVIDWIGNPGYDRLSALIKPLLYGADLEHVAVLYDGQRRDMFVDENGHAKVLPRNEVATQIYRHNWLTQHPKTVPESMAYIVGVAVLFPDCIVWT
jgi:hypothetical protein